MDQFSSVMGDARGHADGPEFIESNPWAEPPLPSNESTLMVLTVRRCQTCGKLEDLLPVPHKTPQGDLCPGKVSDVAILQVKPVPS